MTDDDSSTCSTTPPTQNDGDTSDPSMTETQPAPDDDAVRTDGGTTEDAASDWTDEDDTSNADGDRDRTPERDRHVHDHGGTWSQADLQERLQWLALGVLGIVAIATLYSFYANVSQFIAIWASRRYEPALQAAFALAVLAGSLAGITKLSRNLT